MYLTIKGQFRSNRWFHRTHNNNILGLIIKKLNLRLLAQWHMLGYNIWQKKYMSQLLLLLKIHDPLATWYCIIVPLKTILFYWFWGQNGQIPLFGKIHLIQYHCTFKDNTISLIWGKNGQIPLFSEIFNNLPLFGKYFAIYHLFWNSNLENSSLICNSSLWKSSSVKICHNGTRWPGIKKYKMSRITQVLYTRVLISFKICNLLTWMRKTCVSTYGRKTCIYAYFIYVSYKYPCHLCVMLEIF